MKNNYGNYVVQSALKLAKKSSKEMLINNMLRNIEKMNDKKLINKWKAIINTSIGFDTGRPEKKAGSDKISKTKVMKAYSQLSLDRNEYQVRDGKKHNSNTDFIDYDLDELTLNDKEDKGKKNYKNKEKKDYR